MRLPGRVTRISALVSFSSSSSVELLLLLRAVLQGRLEDDRAVALEAVLPGHEGVPVRVDDLPGELPVRAPGVLLEEVLGRPLAGLVGPEEGHGLHRHRQLAHHLRRLGGQAPALVLGQVDPVAVPVGHRLDEHDDAEDEDDQDRRVEAVAGRAPRQRPAHVAREARVQPEQEDQAADDQQRGPDLRPRRPIDLHEEAGRDAGEAEEQCRACESVHGDQPLQRFESSERRVRNKARMVRFR